MEERARNLREQVRRLGGEFKSAQQKLADYEKRCLHKHEETVYDPIIHLAFHFSGDPPGTMGVDRQLPMDFPETREDRWRRECKKCGLVEYTNRTENEIKKIPNFGGRM
ncbi:MAG: hypothetical protein Q8N63_09025 [Nanoarchaeota archaeon]|nr:hypothetical protein [Nanoarchaeota archaeon]